jgi:aldehyde:ferredoxin oxidoreductase
MIRDHFRVMRVDLNTGRGEIQTLGGRDLYAGGSGLAALLFATFAQPDKPWDDPDQPLIFAIGPLTGLFPLMSKTVCAFKSPYHDQFAESHGGGRSALALRFADLDALVVTGKARTLSCLSIGSRHMEVKDVHFMRGFDIHATGKLFRRMFPGAGHRSILRIGPAGEALSAMACIIVDTYRHFGRLGAGAVMGAKNLKGIAIQGDGSFPLPEGKDYPKLFQDVYGLLTATEMMHKYHNLGTAENVIVMNELKALPFRNMQRTSDPSAVEISGEKFAEKTLLRNAACAGCPVGCIHLGFVREKFMEPNQYLYRQVSYDHEPIFAVGCMLAVTDPFAALDIMEEADKVGLDVMSAGVALAWATEASEKGLVSTAETVVPLRFGDAAAYQQAMWHLARGENEFYRLLASGTLRAAARFGGEDFACVLGQEMAGYATGEVFFVSQALGLRHSHLDSGGYSFDQKHTEKDAVKAVEFLITDEASRCFLTAMVSCLFARGVYTEARLAECLKAVGYAGLAENIGAVSKRIQSERWRLRLATGYEPERVEIPRRFSEVVTWKGPIDGQYLSDLKAEYSRRIRSLATEAAQAGSADAETRKKGKEK